MGELSRPRVSADSAGATSGVYAEVRVLRTDLLRIARFLKRSRAVATVTFEEDGLEVKCGANLAGVPGAGVGRVRVEVSRRDLVNLVTKYAAALPDPVTLTVLVDSILMGTGTRLPSPELSTTSSFQLRLRHSGPRAVTPPLSEEAVSSAPLRTRTPADEAAELRARAEHGDAGAQCKLGFAYADGEGVTKNDELAAAWLWRAAKQGHARAQCELAVMYDMGRGVPRDDTKYLMWIRKAAENGDAAAQCRLGYVYATDVWQLEDNAQAVLWWRKAAERGLAEAQNNLAWMYANGEGVERDYQRAAMWYRKAAELGDVESQFRLGEMYFDGRGVPQDDVQAVVWYCRAVEHEYADAMFRLGWMYVLGRGVPQDYVEAHTWLTLAAGRATVGTKNRCEHDRTALARWMTLIQLTKAEELAQLWAATFKRRQQG